MCNRRRSACWRELHSTLANLKPCWQPRWNLQMISLSLGTSFRVGGHSKQRGECQWMILSLSVTDNWAALWRSSKAFGEVLSQSGARHHIQPSWDKVTLDLAAPFGILGPPEKSLGMWVCAVREPGQGESLLFVSSSSIWNRCAAICWQPACRASLLNCRIIDWQWIVAPWATA